MIQNLFLPIYAAEAGGEFGSMCFMMCYTGTTETVTGTAFFCARAIDIVMRAMGHGVIPFLHDFACKVTTFFADMQFFLHICSKNDDLWLYPRKF